MAVCDPGDRRNVGADPCALGFPCSSVNGDTHTNAVSNLERGRALKALGKPAVVAVTGSVAVGRRIRFAVSRRIRVTVTRRHRRGFAGA